MEPLLRAGSKVKLLSGGSSERRFLLVLAPLEQFAGSKAESRVTKAARMGQP
jgi:hypothetical protein